jgi:MOSC domain-containing protein YiiM
MIKLISIARRKQTRAPMEELFSSTISLESGLEGDFRGKSKNRQITVLSKESWIKVCNTLNEDVSWLLRRANLLIKGFEFLPTDVGRQIRINDVILEITRETDPCQRMEDQLEGLFQALSPSWYGGVCCKVIQGGEVKCGDEMQFIQ